MRVLKVWSGLAMLTMGCGRSPAAAPVDAELQIDASPVDAAAVDAPVDAAPPVHVGGWRMDGADAAGSCHVGVVGPPAIATNRLFHEEPNRKLSAPIIDEDGNLYFTSFLQTLDLVSLTRGGVERWRRFLPGNTSISDLTLAPSGDLVAVSSIGQFPDTVVRLMTFDAATGEPHPGAFLASDLAGPMKVAPDGRVFTKTFVFADPSTSGLEMHVSPTAPARWARTSGLGSFAVAPAGDALVSVERSDGNVFPFIVVSIDAATGAERWRKALPPELTDGPGLAIDGEGPAYVAVATDRREMHVYKFSPAGQMLWDTQNTEDFPTRVLLGADNVYVTANFSFSLRKSDGKSVSSLCGLPLATDGADRVYSACISGTQVTDPLGNVLAEWRGAPNALAIAPDGAVFYWPFATTRFSQLFRIQ